MDALPVTEPSNGVAAIVSGVRRSRGKGVAGWSFPTWLMICALVLYPLSVGPLSWCWEEVILSQDDTNQFRARRDRGVAQPLFLGRLSVLPGIYQPLMWAYGSTPAVRGMMDGYLRLWGRLLILQPLPRFDFRFPKLSPWEDSRSTGLPVQISCGGPGHSSGGAGAVGDFLSGDAGENDAAPSHSGANPISGGHSAESEGAASGSGPAFFPCLYKR